MINDDREPAFSLIPRPVGRTIYLDIYSSRTLADFIKALAEASLAAFPEKSSIGKAFFSFLKSLRPMISYDPVTYASQVQITHQTQQEKELALNGILGFLDGQNQNILIAIDEFRSKRTKNSMIAGLKTRFSRHPCSSGEFR